MTSKPETDTPLGLSPKDREMIDAVVDGHYEVHGSAVKGDLHGSLYAAGRNSVLSDLAAANAKISVLEHILSETEEHLCLVLGEKYPHPDSMNWKLGGACGLVESVGAKLERYRAAIAEAYGYLWHVNNEPGTPQQYPPEKAAYEARKLLRDLLTNEQRGTAINDVRQKIEHQDH